MTEQDTLVAFCKHCGKRHVTAERTTCRKCGGPLLRQTPLFD